MLLQVLDDGMLTDGKGRKINFKNTIIIMTSNLGSQYIQKMQSIGFNNKSDSEEYGDTKDKVMDSLKKFFRPEFLNRLDDIIVFDVLPREIITDIVNIQLERVRARLVTKNITLEVSEKALTYMTEKGYDPQFGARPLKRLIQDEILNKIANALIAGTIAEGDTAYVDYTGTELTVSGNKKAGLIKTSMSARKKAVGVV